MRLNEVLPVSEKSHWFVFFFSFFFYNRGAALQSPAMVMRTEPEAKRLLGVGAQALAVDRKQHPCKMRTRRALGCHLIPSLQSVLLNLWLGVAQGSARQRAPSGKFPAPVTLTRKAFLPPVWLGGFQGERKGEKQALQSPASARTAVCVTRARRRRLTQIALV